MAVHRGRERGGAVSITPEDMRSQLQAHGEIASPPEDQPVQFPDLNAFIGGIIDSIKTWLTNLERKL